jgi:hypothetical protein
MAQLTFQVAPDGLVADVLVNLDASRLIPLRSSGPAASPASGKGLIDTGSDISAVSLPILHQLGIPAIQRTTTRDIGGNLQVNLYRVSLHVLDTQQIGLPWLSQPSLLVMELAPGFPFDAIIGMDVLLTCKLLLDGPARRFTLEF